MTARGAVGCLALASAVWVAGASNAQVPAGVPPLRSFSLAGQDSFERYCTPCHGIEGRGDGPGGAALKTRPPDLTSIARQNSGVFPRARVRDLLTGSGRRIEAHWATDMPVWGPIFRAFESDTRAAVRIDNLVAYLDLIQEGSPEDLGRRLFVVYCANCHGSTGRGSGPRAQELRLSPPDLTQFARRNAGVFPEERVHRIIDGRDISSHGGSGMPIFGQFFRAVAGGASETVVNRRIGAIVRYVESIQERGQ